MVCHRTEPRPPLWKPLNVNSTYPCCQVTVLVTGLCHSGSKISWQNGRNQNKTCAVPDLEVRTKKQQHVSVRSIFSFLLQGTFVNTGDSPPPHTHTYPHGSNSNRRQSGSRVTLTARIKWTNAVRTAKSVSSHFQCSYYILMLGGAAGVLRSQSVCFNTGNVCLPPARGCLWQNATHSKQPLLPTY